MTERCSHEVRTPAPPRGGSVASGKGCVWLPLQGGPEVALLDGCQAPSARARAAEGEASLRKRARSSGPRVSAGAASVLVSFFLCTYYNVVNAWAFWYLFHSFQVSGRGLGQGRAGGGRAPRASRGLPSRGSVDPCGLCDVCVHFWGAGPQIASGAL